MKFIYDDIIMNNRLLLQSGTLAVNSTGVIKLSGNNGTGKTTLVRRLRKLYPDHFIIMAQENDNIFHHCTVEENLMVFDDILKEDVIELLTRYNLDYLLTRNTKKLSGGEKRVIALVRTILINAPITVLDEPTNDISIDLFPSIYQIIKDTSQTRTIILITHDDRIDFFTNEYVISNSQLLLKVDRVDSFSNREIVLSLMNKEIELNKFMLRKKNSYSMSLILILAVIIYSIGNIDFNPVLNKYKSGYYDIRTWNSQYVSEYEMDYVDTAYIGCLFELDKMACIDKYNSWDTDLASGLLMDDRNTNYILEYSNSDLSNYYSIYDEMIRRLAMSDTIDITFMDPLHTLADSQTIAYVPETLSDEQKKILEDNLYTVLVDKTLLENEILLSFNTHLYEQVILGLDLSDKMVLSVVVELNEKTDFYEYAIDQQLFSYSHRIRGREPSIYFQEVNELSSLFLSFSRIILFSALVYLFGIMIHYFTSFNDDKLYNTLYNYGCDEKRLAMYNMRENRVKITSFIVIILSIVVSYCFVLLSKRLVFWLLSIYVLLCCAFLGLSYYAISKVQIRRVKK